MRLGWGDRLTVLLPLLPSIFLSCPTFLLKPCNLYAVSWSSQMWCCTHLCEAAPTARGRSFSHTGSSSVLLSSQLCMNCTPRVHSGSDSYHDRLTSPVYVLQITGLKPYSFCIWILWSQRSLVVVGITSLLTLAESYWIRLGWKCVMLTP